MDRLTKRSTTTLKENGIGCAHFRGAECKELAGHCEDDCPWEEAVWSLAAELEDILYTPNGVQRITMDTIRELVEANNQERTLVLPCKMGDPIYWVVTRHEPPRRVKTKYIMYSQLDWHNLERVLKEYGKTVFTTKEEALAALEGAKS